MTSPRFVNLNGPRPAAGSPPRAGAPRLNLHDPRVQVGGAAVVVVLGYALYKRKQAAAAAGATGATGVDPSATTSGTTATGPYDSTASDVYNAIEPLFEQLAGVAPQQQALLSQILTQLQNGQTGTTSGETSPPTPPVVPPVHVSPGAPWGSPTSTSSHWFPGGPKTSSVPASTVHASGPWG